MTRSKATRRDIHEFYGMTDIYDDYEMIIINAFNDLVMNGNDN